MTPDRKSQAIALVTGVEERVAERLETYADQMDPWDRGTHMMFSNLAQAVLLMIDDPEAIKAHKERAYYVPGVR